MSIRWNVSQTNTTYKSIQITKHTCYTKAFGFRAGRNNDDILLVFIYRCVHLHVYSRHSLLLSTIVCLILGVGLLIMTSDDYYLLFDIG